MSDLRDLYQEMILDHSRNPRNRGPLEEAPLRAEGRNPVCGDQVTVWVDVDEDGVIRRVTFDGKGCAISTASASLMTEALVGRSVDEARHLFEEVHDMLTGDPAGEQGAEASGRADLGKLEVLSGVKEFPMRVKCASLPWHTFLAALEGRDDPARTE